MIYQLYKPPIEVDNQIKLTSMYEYEYNTTCIK